MIEPKETLIEIEVDGESWYIFSLEENDITTEEWNTCTDIEKDVIVTDYFNNCLNWRWRELPNDKE